MDMHSNSVQIPTRPESSGEGQGFDIVGVLWRWKVLPILGVIIGMTLGYLHYTTLPRLYSSRATIQVVSPIPVPTRNAFYAPDELTQMNKQDESIVISSETVLEKAAEKLFPAREQYSLIKNMNAQQIAGWIAGDRKLTVAPAAKDVNTALINVSFVCEDPQLCELVVSAIVDGYRQYLSQEYESVGTVVKNLMQEASKSVNESFVKLLERSQGAKEAIDIPVLWTEDGAADPFAASIQQLQQKLLTLSIEKVAITSRLERANQAIVDKKDPEVILMSLSESDSMEQQKLAASNTLLESSIQSQILESERMERHDLAALKMEEARYLDSVGESHPALAGVRKRIALLQELIKSVREAERAKAAEMVAATEKQKAASANSAYVPLTPAQRLAKRVYAMEESVAAIDLEMKQLDVMIEFNKAESKRLQQSIQGVLAVEVELDQLKKLQEVTLEKLKEIELGPKESQRSLKVLNKAGVGGLYGPKLLPYLFGGGAIGFVLLGALAVLLDLVDKSFRSPDEIAAEIGAPVLGHIPAMEMDKVTKKANQNVDVSLCTIHHSRGRVSEAYRSVRTALFFSNRTGDLKVIQVTSPVPGDGKSTLSSNLAVTMAQSGRNVLLIDADFRRPRIAKLFNIDSDNGMATAVAGGCELDDAIHQSPIPYLSVMPGGKRPSNPAELLSSQRFADLMDALREKFDMIIVDTPPLLAVSDPSAVAAVVDGVVLTMRLRRNVKPLVSRATKVLESVDANILGIVINGVSQEAGYGYAYGYRDYRYSYQYQYGYGYRGYGGKKGYYGAGKYLEESHDIDTDHVLVDQARFSDLTKRDDEPV